MTIKNLHVVNQKALEEVLYHSPIIDKETRIEKATGFATIDKPWLKYYSKGADTREVPNQTLYEALLETSKGHEDDVAFICADRNLQKVTFGEFVTLVDDIAKGLQNMGLKKGDNIASTFKETIEGIALVFAKSRLGLVEHFIDPSNSIESKQEMLQNSDSLIYFLEEDLIDTDLVDLKSKFNGEIVILPNLDSNEVSYDNPEIIKFNDFLNKGKDEVLGEPNKFDKYEVSTVMYTGGSTGKSKGVILTDYIFVSKYYREMFSDWKWGRGRTNLCVLPGIIAFGLSEGIISPLLAGETTVLVDCLQIPRFPEYILTYKPQDVACSPIHIEFLMNHPIISDETDLSFLEMMPCGGDGMTKDSDEKAREFFKAHGAPDVFAQGCGFTESAGAFCYGLAEKNQPGYMGIPLAGNVCGVFDPETGEELKYGEVGEWGVLTDTMMLSYYEDADVLNPKALKRHNDGNIWLHPGDMVHMNENGQIAMHDRTSRTFNLMGLKVYPSSLETVISEHPAVSKCVLTGIPLSSDNMVAITDQKVPIVNVSVFEQFKGQEEVIADQIDDILKEKAPSYIKIGAYIFRDALPYTNRGKIDYSRLEAEGINPAEDRKILIKKFE